jgi:hypothetical protein
MLVGRPPKIAIFKPAHATSAVVTTEFIAGWISKGSCTVPAALVLLKDLAINGASANLRMPEYAGYRFLLLREEEISPVSWSTEPLRKVGRRRALEVVHSSFIPCQVKPFCLDRINGNC